MDTWWLQFYTLCNYITDLGETFQQMLVTKHILLFFGQNLHFCAENVHVSLPLNFFIFYFFGHLKLCAVVYRGLTGIVWGFFLNQDGAL